MNKAMVEKRIHDILMAAAQGNRVKKAIEEGMDNMGHTVHAVHLDEKTKSENVFIAHVLYDDPTIYVRIVLSLSDEDNSIIVMNESVLTKDYINEINRKLAITEPYI